MAEGGVRSRRRPPRGLACAGSSPGPADPGATRGRGWRGVALDDSTGAVDGVGGNTLPFQRCLNLSRRVLPNEIGVRRSGMGGVSALGAVAGVKSTMAGSLRGGGLLLASSCTAAARGDRFPLWRCRFEIDCGCLCAQRLVAGLIDSLRGGIGRVTGWDYGGDGRRAARSLSPAGWTVRTEGSYGWDYGR